MQVPGFSSKPREAKRTRWCHQTAGSGGWGDSHPAARPSNATEAQTFRSRPCGPEKSLRQVKARADGFRQIIGRETIIRQPGMPKLWKAHAPGPGNSARRRTTTERLSVSKMRSQLYRGRSRQTFACHPPKDAAERACACDPITPRRPAGRRNKQR